jgi:triosephosphate isomerase (TIM)
MLTSILFSVSLICGSHAFAPQGINERPRFGVSLEMARKTFISGNWKLNPQTKAEAIKLATDIAASITPSSPQSDVALFVPYPFIDAVASQVGNVLSVGGEVCKLSNK